MHMFTDVGYKLKLQVVYWFQFDWCVSVCLCVCVCARVCVYFSAIPLQRRILTMLQWLHLPEGERWATSHRSASVLSVCLDLTQHQCLYLEHGHYIQSSHVGNVRNAQFDHTPRASEEVELFLYMICTHILKIIIALVIINNCKKK